MGSLLDPELEFGAALSVSLISIAVALGRVRRLCVHVGDLVADRDLARGLARVETRATGVTIKRPNENVKDHGMRNSPMMTTTVLLRLHCIVLRADVHRQRASTVDEVSATSVMSTARWRTAWRHPLVRSTAKMQACAQSNGAALLARGRV
jgi:hypothetical protein